MITRQVLLREASPPRPIGEQPQLAALQAVFEQSPIGQVFSTMDGVITAANDAMAHLLGWTPADLVGVAVRDLVDTNELERIQQATTAMLAEETATISSIRHYLHRDGHQVPARVISTLLRGTNGEPNWWFSILVDIAEEERSRAVLERTHTELLGSARRLSLLKSVATAANDSTSVLDLAPHVLESVCDHFGWPAGALVRLAPDNESELVAVHLTSEATALTRYGLVTGARDLVDGGPTGVEVSGQHVLVPVPGRDGAPWMWLFDGCADDIGDDEYQILTLIGVETARVVERQVAEQRLRQGEDRFRSVFAESPLPMGLTFGDSGTYSAVNDALCRLVGRDADKLLGCSARDIVHPDDIALTDPAGAAALAAPDGRSRVELRLLHSSGAVLTCVVTLTWLYGVDGSHNLLAQMEDVTESRRAEETLRRQAEEDTPTGLANRTRLNRVLRDMAAANESCVVLFIDLDGFKLINDTRGHDVGDEVLFEVADRLRAAVRPSDVVVRFGGDEFVVLCRREAGDRGRPDAELAIARRLADRVQARLKAPISTASGVVTVSASMGIASGVVDSAHTQDLVGRADLAMYHAKRLGKDRCEMYDAGLHERALAYQRTEAALRNAVAENRFVLHYQPVVDLASSSIRGFESLVRLVDEAGELVPPDQFIAVAEQSGLIVDMGTWVLRKACRTIAELRRSTGLSVSVGVNIAAQQVARPDFVATVLSALADAKLPERALALELTETALLEADGPTLDQLTALRSRGISIALDDFGTGYSSLSYLRTFPVTHLKVDKSFVSGITTGTSDLAIVRAVTQLASNLGLTWIAEGIETEDQRQALTALGSGYGQGFLYSRPLPEQQLAQVLATGVMPPTCRSASDA